MFQQMPKFDVDTYARFRYSTRRKSSPRRFRPSGEVEDYKVYLEPGYCGDGPSTKHGKNVTVNQDVQTDAFGKKTTNAATSFWQR
jgi:hypothetical protein